MYTAGKDQTLPAFLIGPVCIDLGPLSTNELIYVAPIQDDMLLGMDFHRKHATTIDFKRDVILVHNQAIHIAPRREQEVYSSYQVVLSEEVSIPANSVANTLCSAELETGMEYVIEKEEDLPVLSPRVLVEGSTEQQFSLCLVNISDREISLDSGTVVGNAFPILEQMQRREYDTVCQVVSGPEDNLQECQMPGHLQEMYESACEELDTKQRERLKSVLIEFGDVFAKSDLDLGNFNEVSHTIDTGSSAPIKHKIRRTPLHFLEEEDAHMEKMLAAGVIQPSVSEWAAAPVLVRKRDGSVRWCVDYRALNKVTRKDVFPLPLIEDCMDALEGNCWFSKLDANSAYWQIPLDEDARKKSAFITKNGLFEFKKMPFGLCNSPATYSRAISLVLRGLTWKSVLSFLDDICVLGKSFDEHLKNLREVLGRFQKFQLKLKPRKCEIFKKKVPFLGRQVSQSGIEVNEESIKVVQQWPTPQTAKEVLKFLGLANYHRQFIPRFSEIAEPLYRVSGTKTFHWDKEQEEAFELLKTKLSQPPVLAVPNRDGYFILDTDASDTAVAAELVQIQEGRERVIAYGSFALTTEQKKYCTTRKELLAIIRFTRQYRVYLLGRKFGIRTDHASLVWLLRFKEPQGQIARWLEELSQFDMEILYRPGKQHTNADALSRIPMVDGNICPLNRLEDLPCKGCAYCKRATDKWGTFLEEVDYVVPLSRTVTPSKVQCVAKVASTGIHKRSLAEIAKSQKSDPDISILYEWLESEKTFTQDELALASTTAKFLWINRTLFFLENQVIYRKDDIAPKLLVPFEYREEVMSLSHDIPLAGHQGINRTKEKIRENFVWRGMSRDVKNYVRTCAVCNRNKKPNVRSKCAMTLFHAGAPMERVHLDFLGPLPVTSAGNQHILVMVDQFTKWVECVPLPSQTAEVTARAAVNEFFCRFGCPLEIFTDQGRNFESGLFKALCELLQIHKARTTPYHPASNGQVERYNRTLMDSIRCFVSKNQTDWDVWVPQIAGALRASVSRSTGYTPNRLMLGKEVNLPASLMFPTVNAQEREKDKDGYVQQLEEKLLEVHSIARDTLRESQKRQKRDFDLRLQEHKYQEGDVVYILDKSTEKGLSPKLSAPWKGPGMILKVLSPYVYRVQIGRSLAVINHDLLKLCQDNVVSLPKWIQRLVRIKQSGQDDGQEIFCVCRKGDDGSLMIQCDECLEWYHGSCVGIDEKKARRIDQYSCSVCSP